MELINYEKLDSIDRPEIIEIKEGDIHTIIIRDGGNEYPLTKQQYLGWINHLGRIRVSPISGN
jgi:hypothetical protein